MTDTPTHEGELLIAAITNANAPPAIGVPTVKFVRYPGAQQLTLWLPQHGYFGYGALRVLGPDGAAIEQGSVRDRLNGSVQILWDTLGWAPGAYRIEIEHDEGWRHEVQLEKLAEGVKPPPPPAPPPEPPKPDAPPIVYRDGAGNILPNTDLEMREGLGAKLATAFGRRLEFEGNFRGGTIIYIDGERRISFWHEMAGGDAKFYIDIPPREQWEARTGVPLAEREEILRFVAEETKRMQAPSWKYRIEEREILFF